ncbi:AAA family ATPase [Parachryseolinea silvisoli]|uniref:AAA family ATPase n=1 Tax=Parachryseolinea silvisoli TaxID=2873601 RepID=UPI002265AB97|nr:AAA family ATPase [Parachryseolinea silvisoli]MCD9018811.1 AAA family ATPase [Parachryseolinea silvisoli]
MSRALNKEFLQILHTLNNTSDNLYITGRAGTGKSTLLKYFIRTTSKKHVVLAPTGTAALNIGGQTIHSFFRFEPEIINPATIKIDHKRADLFRTLEMIIIDEVSMVRADLMDGIDIALRKNCRKPHTPFGGIQMVFVGDLFQLPPVLHDKDEEVIYTRYGGEYFFHAPVFQNFNLQVRELTTVVRQSPQQTKFKALLDNIRVNRVHDKDLKLLQSRCKKPTAAHKHALCLTTTRKAANSFNKKKLDEIDSVPFQFEGTLLGEYEKLQDLSHHELNDKFPAPYILELKKGAQIMMVKNDPQKRWANGSIGKISKVGRRGIAVIIDDKEYKVAPEQWSEIQYELNKDTGAIEPRVVAAFVQYPLQLAFAMTIHKSQGKTFSKITIDTGTGAFAHGQMYVALSRCTTLQGITLVNPVDKRDIIVDPRIIDFYTGGKITRTKFQKQSPAVKKALLEAISRGNPITIEYRKTRDEISKRTISRVEICNDYQDNGYEDAHIRAYCHLRKAERTFKIDRIITIKTLRSLGRVSA